MPNTVIALKKSAVSANVPSSLANGELAINFADGVIFYKHANGTIASISSGTISFGTVNAAGTLLLADQINDVLDIRAGQNIIITGDAVNDRMTINADLTAANSWSNTKLSNGTVTLAGALTTTGQVTANAQININATGGDEGGEIQLQATGNNTNWSIDSYQNNARIFARTGTSVSNVNFFHAVAGGSIRLGVNRTDPTYTLDVNGIVNASAIYVNGTPLATGTVDLTPANNWANTVGTAGNNYMITIVTGVNSNTVNNAVGANGWANTLSTSDRAISNAAANSANAYTVTVGAASNTWANTRLANVVAGGPITLSWSTTNGYTNATINVATSGVTAASYGNDRIIPSITVDSYGRITTVANVAIPASGGYFQGNNGDVGSSSGLGDIFRVHSNTLTQNVTIYSGNNAIAAGPLTISSGKTLTVQTGARAVIV